MADLAGHAGGPAVDVAVDHQAGADPGRHFEVGEVVDSHGLAPVVLRERPQVGVVVDEDWHLEVTAVLAFARKVSALNPLRSRGIVAWKTPSA